MELYRYIELNAVRAAMVAQPRDYRWSSARVHLGLEGGRVEDHELLLALGANAQCRAARCCELLAEGSRRSEQT